MVSKTDQTYVDELKYLSSLRPSALREALKDISPGALSLLRRCVNKILLKKGLLDAKVVNKLYKHRDRIRQFADKKTTPTTARKIVVQSGKLMKPIKSPLA